MSYLREIPSGDRASGLLTFSAFLAFLAALVLSSNPVWGVSASTKETGRAKTHVVEIRQFKFLPETLQVKPGDTIVWKNLDIAPHTATAKNWDSGKLTRNQRWALKVTRKGTTEYICDYHPAMKGRIIVN